MTSVFGIKVQINKKVIRLVLPPSLSASLSLIHNVFVDKRVWNKLVCSWVRLEPTGLTSVFGIS